MNKYILSTFFSLILLISSVFTTPIFAQTNNGPDVGGDTGPIINDRGTMSDGENTFEPGVGGGPNDATISLGGENGLYWLWLLPLLAIPLLYFVWRSNDEATESRGFKE